MIHRDFTRNSEKIYTVKKLYTNIPIHHRVAVRMVYIFCICLLVSTLLIFTTGCGGSTVRSNVNDSITSNNKTDCYRLGLQGQVKQYSTYDIYFEEKFGRYIYPNFPLDWQITESIEFLKSSNISKATYYWIATIPSYKEEFKYDSNGKLTESIIHAYDIQLEKYSLNFSYLNFYDITTGKIDRIEGYEYDGEEKESQFSWIHIYEYPDDHKTIISNYDQYGFFKWNHIQKYDSRGMRIESDHYQYDEKREQYVKQWSESFKYDSKGNRIEWSRYDSGGSVEWKSKFKYDDAGNEIEYVEYDSENKITHKYFYRYISSDGFEKSRVELDASYEEFIKNGLDPEKIIHGDNWFDSQGNWTVKITLEDVGAPEDALFEITNIEKRIIEYY